MKKKPIKKSKLKITLKDRLSSVALWIAPLCFAVFPTLVIYDHNIDQLEFSRLFIPLLYSIAFMILSSCSIFVLFKDKYKTALFSSIWMLLFFSYGYIYLQLADIIPEGLLPLSINKVLLTGYILVLLGSGWILSKSQKDLKTISTLVTVIGSALVVINLVSIIPFEVQRQISSWRVSHYVDEELGIPEIHTPIVKPDIYYLVFDRYGRQDIMEQYLEYDNSSHMDYLRQQGFMVGDQSNANYPNTFISLSSTLNMTYLDFLPETMGVNQRDRVSVYKQLIENNRIARILKSQGYTYILAGSAWDPTRLDGISDNNFNQFANFDEFHLYIYERTLWNTLKGFTENDQLFTGVERLNRMGSNIPYRMESINYQSSLDKPLFVFAHFLTPHDPNVLDSDCTPLSFEEIRMNFAEQGYAKEIDCSNKVMHDLTELIKNRDDKRPAILIFQSDEGPYLPNEYFNYKSEVPDNHDSYVIHSGILNAVYIPSKEDPSVPVDYEELGLTTTASPVNTFRVILNYYFGSNLPLLEDKVFYFYDGKKPYIFHEVTDQLTTKE